MVAMCLFKLIVGPLKPSLQQRLFFGYKDTDFQKYVAALEIAFRHITRPEVFPPPPPEK